MKENFDVYWLATYKELDGEAFGALNSLIYETEGDAVNAIKNDIEEYKLSYKNEKIEVREYGNQWTMHINGTLVCIWELQAVRMSKEFNEIDD